MVTVDKKHVSVRYHYFWTYDFEPPVVYGGGLKVENAGMLAQISTIDGGLVALTKFTGEIGFSVKGLSGIIQRYLVNKK